jgi:tRNA CCA-adding enzyme
LDEIIPVDVRKKILLEITPTIEEIDIQKQIISNLTEALIAFSEKSDQEYSFIEAQGSTGKKQTQLKGAGDIDLFVALNPDEHETTLSLPYKERDAILNRALDAIVDEWFIPAFKDIESTNMLKTYSQHPYLSLEYLGVDVDILVCFDLTKEELASSGPVTAVDRTIHHTQFVAGNMRDDIREDIRILKSFVRANHTYGDVCPVGQMGFTGYSLELLVILQEGLDRALYALKELHRNPIDVKKRPLEKLLADPSFRDNHIFIIDPTDTNRNVASSFSKRAYDWLRLKTVQFLEIADGTIADYSDFVIEKPIPTNPLPSWLAPHSFAYTFNSDGLHHYTILRDKLYRYARKIASQLQSERTGESRFGKVLFEICFDSNQFSLGFLIEKITASETYSRKGPPVGLDGSKRFSDAHKDVYEQDGYLWVNETRKWTASGNLLDDIIGKHNIKGLVLDSGTTNLDDRVRNVLLRYVLPVEPEFPVKGTV